MELDLGRLRRGEWVAAVAAVLLFVLMFFTWYDVSVDAGPLRAELGGVSAWQAFNLLDIYLLVVIVAALTLAVLTATQRAPALPVTTAVVVTALAALGTVMVVYRLIDVPGEVPDGVDVSRTIWAFLGLLAVAAITAGGYASMRDEGTGQGDASGQAGAGSRSIRVTFGNLGDTQTSSAPPTGAPPSGDPPPAGG